MAAPLKAGWEYAPGAQENDPNAQILNSQTGQRVTVSNPAYTNAPGMQPIDNGPIASPTGGAPITSQQQVANTTANVGQTAAQGAPTTVAQSFQQALINQLNPTPIGVNSPSVKPAIDANNLMEQRAQARNQNALAERAAAMGVNGSGGFETGLNGLAQARAGREASFAGNAVQQGNNLQNQNMMQALGLAGGQLQNLSGQDLQKYIADLDASVRREGIGSQSQLGNADIDVRKELGGNANNISLLGLLLNNSQFGQQLGQNASQFGQQLDQNGFLSLLGLV